MEQSKIIDTLERYPPYSEIVKDNLTIAGEHFEIFKAACEAEAAKKVEVHEGASTEEHWVPPPQKPWLRQEEVHMGQGGRGSRKSGHPRPLGEFHRPAGA